MSEAGSETVLVIDLRNDNQYQQLLAGSPQTRGMRAGRVYLEPGQACGRHSTEAHEELLVFLSGRGQALVGDEQTTHPISKGKVLYIPPHSPHNIENTSDEPLIYIYCVAPVQSSLDNTSAE